MGLDPSTSVLYAAPVTKLERLPVSERGGYCTIQSTAVESWLSRLLGGSIMLLLIVQIAGGTGPFAAPWKGPALMITFGVTLAIYIAWQWVFIRIRRNLHNCGLLLCPRCRHPVLADEQEGYIRCPECGYRNATELVRDSWEARYWVTLAHLRTADLAQHLDVSNSTENP